MGPWIIVSPTHVVHHVAGRDELQRLSELYGVKLEHLQQLVGEKQATFTKGGGERKRSAVKARSGWVLLSNLRWLQRVDTKEMVPVGGDVSFFVESIASLRDDMRHFKANRLTRFLAGQLFSAGSRVETYAGRGRTAAAYGWRLATDAPADALARLPHLMEGSPFALPSFASSPPEPTPEGLPDLEPTPEAEPYCRVAHFGRLCGTAAGHVFDSAEAPALLASALERVWDACVAGGIDPLKDTGKVREDEREKQANTHAKLARNWLGWNDETRPLPCGALHGGWTAKGGGAPQQRMRFVGAGGGAHQAPYLWKMDKLLDETAHNVLTCLQYSMEYMLLLDNPEAWLRAYELYGDLDADGPAYGRLYNQGLYNQLVINRNLVLCEHTDRFNHPDSVETLLVIETGPTGLRLALQLDGETTVVASRDGSAGARMAALSARLSQITHGVRVCEPEDAPPAPWSDRWSVGFYLSTDPFTQHRRFAEAAAARAPSPPAARAPSPPTSTSLAASLTGFGLPERAAGMRALQQGGWLAARYSRGAPWHHLGPALGQKAFDTGHGSAPGGIYVKKRPRGLGGRSGKVYNTRLSGGRTMRSTGTAH